MQIIQIINNPVMGFAKRCYGWLDDFTWLNLLLFLISPTRLIANYLKRELDTEKHSLLIKGLNTTWLTVSCLILSFFLLDNVADSLSVLNLLNVDNGKALRFELFEIVLFVGLILFRHVFKKYKLGFLGNKLLLLGMIIFIVLSSCIDLLWYKENIVVSEQNIKLVWQQPIELLFAVVLIFWYAISHVNEVFIAFYNDVFDKLSKSKSAQEKKHGIEYDERIRLALRSYIGLIIEYGIIYYVICFLNYISIVPGNEIIFFEHGFDTFVDALYFSGVTIMTLGYGDILPSNSFSRLMSVYEVLNGMLLVVVTFTVYVSLHLNEVNSGRDVKDLPCIHCNCKGYE